MENKSLNWCFKIKDGLRITEPNENLSESYLNEAKSSLERAEKDFNDGDLLWATVVIYYAEYYMRVGKGNDVKAMLKEAKIFISIFNEIILNLNQEEIDDYRSELKKLSK